MQALNLFRRAGDQAGQAWAHSVGAVCSRNDGDLAGAVTQNEQALVLFRRVGHRTGQGWVLADLALLHARLGNADLARGYARQAIGVAPDSEDPATLAIAWAALGLVRSRPGEHRQAISCYRQALAHARERKTPMARFSLGLVLAGYGDACRRAGDLPAAVEAWQQARANPRRPGTARQPPASCPAGVGPVTEPVRLIARSAPAVWWLILRAEDRRASEHGYRVSVLRIVSRARHPVRPRPGDLGDPGARA